jgi:hypothetical protein
MGDSRIVNRFFKSDAARYEQVRLALDAAWGHPNAEAETCFLPAALAPRGVDGLPMLSVNAAFCELAAVKQTLPALLASGAVVEIAELEFQQAIASL